MRALRLFALVAVLLLAYFAQYIFDHGTLAGLYPAWLLARFPFMIGTTLWLSQDLYTLALWLLGGSALVFGLLTPAWPATPRGGTEHAALRPTARWALPALLAGSALVVGWGWTSLPVRIDATSAAFGLQAQALLNGQGQWLLPGVTGAPQMASLPLSLLAAATGSAPAATHLLGLLSALGMVAATCLLAAELFVASAHRDALALLAGGITLSSLALLHFGRLAAWLPATTAGVAAGALLLAGHRRQNRAWLAGSGLLIALASTLDRSGLAFFILLLLWWPSLHYDEGKRGRLHFFTWSSALLLGLLPLLLSFLLNPQAAALYLHGPYGEGAADWWSNLLVTATTIFWTADASPVFGMGGPFIASLLAPLFVLGCGSLLMSVDRPLGWRMLSALAVTLLWSSANNKAAPYWPALLPLLPLAGIAIAYALDRIGAFWHELSGGQTPVALEAVERGAPLTAEAATSTAVLAVGLLLAAAASNAASYYQLAANSGDPPSYTGRALAALDADAVALLVASDERYAVPLGDPVVQFAAGDRANQALAVSAAALPRSLPAGALLIVQGADGAALAAARSQYPEATLEVVRDLRANPRLFLLRLP